MAGARPDTWMPWYIGDFMRDTMHLDHNEDAAYRRLIDACWMRNGQLPNDDAQLARICKMGPKLWRKVRPVVSEFFRIETDGWHHKRVDLELEKAHSRMCARIKGADKTNAKRYGGAPAAEVFDSPGTGEHRSCGQENKDHESNKNSNVVLAERQPSETVTVSPRARALPSPSYSSSLRSEDSPPNGGRQSDRRIAATMVEEWNRILVPPLAKPVQLSHKRIVASKSRLAGQFRNDIAEWIQFLQRVKETPFLLGDNDRGWRADYDFCTAERSVLAVLEGKYERANGKSYGSTGVSQYRAPDAPPPETIFDPEH